MLTIGLSTQYDTTCPKSPNSRKYVVCFIKEKWLALIKSIILDNKIVILLTLLQI